MKRKHILAVAALVGLLLAAAGGWWVYRQSEPSRPPELFGKVEAVRHSDYSGSQFLIRSTQPNRPGWDSAQNTYHRQTGLPCWVTVRDAVPVRQRGGGHGEVAVGQTVSVWCSGPMAASMPPIWGGDLVVIEPADR
jgi:hypothetical protein